MQYHAKKNLMLYIWRYHELMETDSEELANKSFDLIRVIFYNYFCIQFPTVFMCKSLNYFTIDLFAYGLLNLQQS